VYGVASWSATGRPSEVVTQQTGAGDAEDSRGVKMLARYEPEGLKVICSPSGTVSR
jgi:hypothetical protein